MNIVDVIGRMMYYTFRPFIKMPQLLSIYFHNPTPEAFEKVITWVQSKGYNFISIPELLEYMEGNKEDRNKHCVVTFDDAWMNNLNLIPIIEHYQIPITIFAPVTPLLEGNYWWEYVQEKGGHTLSEQFKNYEEDIFKQSVDVIKKEIRLKRTAMTIEDLKNIDKNPLVNIQSHSYTHPILTHLSDESVENEMKKSKEYLTELLDKVIYAFCYPNGTLSNREIDLAKKYYHCAFSTIQDSPRVGGNLYTIPRYALTNNYGSNLAKMLGIWKWIRR